MPVRAIKKVLIDCINDRIAIKVPVSVINVYGVGCDRYLCEVVGCFDTNKNLVCKINETEKITPYQEREHYYYYLSLSTTEVAKKYGFVKDEYLEIIFNSIERTKEVERTSKNKGITETKITEIIPIFPARMVEDLEDFVAENDKKCREGKDVER